jgi:hypothetical protein
VLASPLLLLLSLLAQDDAPPPPAPPPPPPAPHGAATRTTVPPVVDGRLDDEAWKGATPTSTFTQQIPFDGRPPSERTVLRVVYDDEAIYFGFDCEQKGSPIIGLLTRRDHDSESEWVWVQIDSRGDGKNAVQLAVNVAGVLADGSIHDQTVYGWEWDENWEAKTARRADGWSVEIRVPLRILRFDSTLPVQSWGLQAARFIAERQETDLWAYTPRDVAGGVARLGHLDDLRDLKPGGRFEIRPFVLGRLTRQDAGSDTVGRGLHPDGSVGLDLKWHVSQDLTLDTAVLPDFAQVEADQLILNLNNVETFLPEKRPLFLEGVDAFSTPLTVFYSRRVGTPPLSPGLRGTAEKLVEVQEPAMIFGAAKLSGRLSDSWTIGALAALTEHNQLKVLAADGRTQQDRLTQPRTMYGVLRLKRELGRNAYVGMIATAAVPVSQPAGGYPITVTSDMNGTRQILQLCPSGDAARIGAPCFRDAYLGGVDGYWRSEGGDYVAGAQIVESMIQGGSPRTLLDGTTIGPGDHAPGAWLRVAKEGGKHVIGSLEYTGSGRKLEYNDLGYLVRQNLHELKASVGYHTFEPGRLTTETTSALQVDSRFSLDGLDLGQTFELNTRWRLRSFWTAALAADFTPARFDDREIGDGAALQRARAAGGRVEIYSDPRRGIAASVVGNAQLIPGAINTAVQASLVLHLLPQLEIELAPQLTYASGEPRYAGRDETTNDYLFGRLLARSAGAILHATYTFTPQLTLQTYAQLFLASGHYTDLRAVAAGPGQKITLANIDASRAVADAPPDFEIAALNVNVVLRWEYHLGSTLFLVYSRSQVPTVDMPSMPPRLNLDAIRSNAVVDVVLLKLAYWWAS